MGVKRISLTSEQDWEELRIGRIQVMQSQIR